MPKPKPDEDQKEFHARCVKEIMGEGKESDQANAICYSIWDQEKKQECIKKFVKHEISAEEAIDEFMRIRSQRFR